MGTSRYLVVSDLHLCDIEDLEEGWKDYKKSRGLFDAELDAMLAHFEADGAPGDALTLVLNGDIFDFDLVTAIPDEPSWSVGPIERTSGLVPNAPKSVWKLERILADHPGFLATVARFAAAGHKVVFVIGNHDTELWFPAVQDALRAAVAAAAPDGARLPPDAVTIETWFYYVPGQIYVEHGHQYDYYSSYRYVLDPTYEQGGERLLALPTGNLSNRYILSNIGTFNPHATDYILSLFGYLRHWWNHYVRRGRSLGLTWLVGSLRTLFALLNIRAREPRQAPEGYDGRLEDCAAHHGLTPHVVKALHGLHHEPITSRIFKIIREFWLDRVALATLMTLATVVLAFAPVHLAVKIVVPFLSFPLIWFVYQWLAGNDNALNLEYKSHAYAYAIASHLRDVRLVVFGHTHVPNLIPVSRGVTFANTGTWAPIWEKGSHAPAAGLRNYVHAVFRGGGEPSIELGSWVDHRDAPSPTRAGRWRSSAATRARG